MSLRYSIRVASRGARLGRMAQDKADSGLSEVEPPTRYRPKGGYTIGRLAAIARQLKRRRGRFVSDKHCYRSRSAANYRAETLAAGLVSRNGTQPHELERRTWEDPKGSGKWYWAIRLRPLN